MKKLAILIAILLWSSVSHAGADDFFSAADRLYERNDFAALEKLSRQEIAQDPESLDALFFLIAMRLKEGDEMGAEPLIVQFAQVQRQVEKRKSEKVHAPVILMDSHHAVLYRYLGEREFNREHFAESVYWLDRAKGSYFNDPMLNFFLGISHKQLGHYDEALKYLHRQLKINPAEPSPLYNIACVYSERGDEKNAIAWLRRAVAAYKPFAEEAKNDKDFDNIRNSKAFAEIMGK